MGSLTERQEYLRLRQQDRACANCRYFREEKTGCFTSECLLLGRTMGVSNDAHDLRTWAWNRLCDGWKRRPKTWGLLRPVKESPYWHDPHLPRETLQRLRRRLDRKILSSTESVSVIFSDPGDA